MPALFSGKGPIPSRVFTRIERAGHGGRAGQGRGLGAGAIVLAEAAEGAYAGRLAQLGEATVREATGMLGEPL